MGESSRFFLRFFSFCVSLEELLLLLLLEFEEADKEELLSWGRLVALPGPLITCFFASLLPSLLTPVMGVMVIVVAGDSVLGVAPTLAGAFSGMISMPPVRCTSTCCCRGDLPSPAMGVMLTQCFRLGVLSFHMFLYLSAISLSLALDAVTELGLLPSAA